ncbi:MAG: hypothetical protein AAGK97_08320 [Bacteroidota bacterium]
MKNTFTSILIILIFSFSTSMINQIQAQCNNLSQFPPGISNAPNYKDSVLTSGSGIFAGEFYKIRDFELGKTYIFTSSADSTDFITITNDRNPTDPDYLVYAFGNSPLTYISNFQDTFKVHINLLSPPCGAESIARDTYVYCSDCDEANNVGIGTSNPTPSAILDIQSQSQGIRIPSMNTTQRNSIADPVDGLMIYNTEENEISIYHEDEGGWRNTAVKERTIIIPYQAFTPVFQGQDYNSDVSLGTRWEISGFGRLDAPLSLPVGSTITAIRYYFRDNSIANISFGLGSNEFFSSNESRNFNFTSGGQNSNDSGYIPTNLVIQPATQYKIIVGGAKFSNLAVKGVEIRYLEP